MADGPGVCKPAARAAFSAESGGFQPALVDVALGRRRGHLLGELALEVVALPGLLSGLRIAAKDALVELGAVLFPDVVLMTQLGVAIHAPDHRLDLVQGLVLHEGDET